jgi:methyl-accepting chemotaxis protein
MLSPHEFATLMLVKDSPEQIDVTSQELDILREQQLVAMEQLASGIHRLSLTDDGHSLLQAIRRAH